MKKYRVDASSAVRHEYGVDLIAGLRMFPETAPLADAFEPQNVELHEADERRRAARVPMLVARAQLRVANHLTDAAVRSLARAAEIADGGRRGPLHSALFPNGLAEIVAPVGARQVAAVEALAKRLANSRTAGIDPLRAEWAPKLDASLATLRTATAAYDSARAVVADAFAKEIALRDAHFVALDSVIGHVRATFPNDRTKQDAIFPQTDYGHASADAATDDEHAADATSAGG